MEAIISQYQNLSRKEVVDGVAFCANGLMKLGKFSNEKTATSYVLDLMQKMGDSTYKEKFFRIYFSIDTTGIALKNNSTASIYKSMTLQKSIVEHFKALDYRNSTLHRSLHGARALFASMPNNSVITFNL